MIIENCPICNNELRPIQDNENPDFIDNWFCSICSITWNSEDLEFTPKQKSVKDFL